MSSSSPRRPAAAGPFRGRTGGGFTLVEILTVLAVIAIMISLAAPLIGDYPEGRELASEADNVESQMAYARLIAVSSGAPVELRFYLE
ncbi:MAG: prepilin-type N-terminal cleavage/methylation domain-containing protein, partial [Akkermansiaceae bacterium]|nr:prepilin-type N-terminal cleavage/methylation domain-containing protein [Akkermansiaceae bacterium]